MLQSWQSASKHGSSVLRLPSQHPELKPLKIFAVVKTVLCCIPWPSEHSTLCHCCTASSVQWHEGGGLRDVTFFSILEANILEGMWNRRMWTVSAGGFFEIHVGSNCSSDVRESEIFWPAGVMCCHLTATVWRRAANGLTQQFCNVSCSCVLIVCSVLQTVHSSKVMLAAEHNVTCTAHWQLWARLCHRGDQVHWTCV